MKYRYQKHASKYITVMATFPAGSMVEFGSEYPNGIAHLREHMAFKTISGEAAKAFNDKVARYGGMANAWTSESLCSYYIQMPEDQVDMALSCLFDLMCPTFPEEELDKEREVVKQEIRMYIDDLDTLVRERMNQLVFKNYLSRNIAGTEESVSSITRQNLVDFNKEFYKSSNMLLTLVAPKNYVGLVKKYFGSDDRFDVDYKNYYTGEIEYRPSKSAKVFKQDQQQDSIMISFGSPTLHNTTKQLKPVHSVFNAIFGSGMNGRLFSSIREDLGLVYGIGGYLDYDFGGTVYSIHTSTEPGNTKKAIKGIGKEIEKIVADGVTDDELEIAKNKIKGAVYSSLDTSMGAISEILNGEIYGFDVGLGLIDKVNKVTVKDVNKLAQTIFSGNRYVVIGTGAK